MNITDVKSNIYNSELTGEHQVWKVSVNEESTGNIYDYFIDKTSRKIYKITVSSKGNNLMLVDKETDFNPFKNKFDKEATLKMLTKGNSVISGEAFAKDDRSGKDNSKIRIDAVSYTHLDVYKRQVCDIRKKHDIQRISLRQWFVIGGLFLMIVLLFVLFQDFFVIKPHNLFI